MYYNYIMSRSGIRIYVYKMYKEDRKCVGVACGLTIAAAVAGNEVSDAKKYPVISIYYNIPSATMAARFVIFFSCTAFFDEPWFDLRIRMHGFGRSNDNSLLNDASLRVRRR